MTYVPRDIKDRVAVGDDIFIVEDLGGNKIRLIPSPTHVSEAGTPVNKALLQPMENHMGDVANPHATTKEQVGLGSVQNYGIATQVQAEAGTANNVYMTPLRVKEAIASQVPTLPSFYKLLDSFISSGEVGIDQVAGIKNSMYRGKNLGTSVTPEQYTNISNGTFKDLYIGDYWTINGTQYIIAAFNYYLNSANSDYSRLTTNHITLVSAGSMYTHRMNPTDTTEGGYVNSEMYTSHLVGVTMKIHLDFPDHVITHRRLLCNTAADGQASFGGWFESDVELMNEVMVFGSVVNGKGGLYNIGTDKVQLPLFALRPDLLNIDESWWLRDVVSATRFARVGDWGNADAADAGNGGGVRPVFSIS